MSWAQVRASGRWLVLMLVAAYVLALPGTARAETTSYQVSETTPIATATENPCTGEPVTLTGTYHFTSNYSVTVDETGTHFHSLESKKFSLSGTATLTGARYQNEQQQMSEENGTFTVDTGVLAPYESTNEMTMLLIRQGETTRQDDFYVKIIAHITYNASGVVTVSGATVNVFCR
jgi:hypothetical protein